MNIIQYNYTIKIPLPLGLGNSDLTWSHLKLILLAGLISYTELLILKYYSTDDLNCGSCHFTCLSISFFVLLFALSPSPPVAPTLGQLVSCPVASPPSFTSVTDAVSSQSLQLPWKYSHAVSLLYIQSCLFMFLAFSVAGD